MSSTQSPKDNPNKKEMSSTQLSKDNLNKNNTYVSYVAKCRFVSRGAVSSAKGSWQNPGEGSVEKSPGNLSFYIWRANKQLKI